MVAKNKIKWLLIKDLSKEDKDRLFSQYMHNIWEWKTVDWQVIMTNKWYTKWADIIDWFRDFLENYWS